jgi:excisionase family DNA binding protein
MNKKQAAEFLGITPRTLERHMSAGRIAYEMRRGKTGEEAYFDPASVERFRADHLAPVIPGKVEEASQALATTSPVSLARQAPTSQNGHQFAAMIAAAINSAPSISDLAHKLTLSLVEASRLSGLSRNHLRAAIEAKKLKARIIGRGFRVKREDLDLYVRKL